MKHVKQGFYICRESALLTVLVLLMFSVNSFAYQTGDYFWAQTTVNNTTFPSGFNGYRAYYRITDYATHRVRLVKFDWLGEGHKVLVKSSVTPDLSDEVFYVEGIEAVCQQENENCYISEIVFPTDIPAGLTECPFKSIYSLSKGQITTLNIPANVTYVADGAFEELTFLNKITVDAGNTYYTADADGVLYRLKDKDGMSVDKSLVCYPRGKDGDTYTIASDVKVLCEKSFRYCKLQSVTIPASVERIERTVLRETEGSQGNNTVEYVQETDNQLFMYSTTLTHINVAAANTNFTSHDGVLYTKEDDEWKLLLYPPNRTDASYTVMSGATSIKPAAFYNVSSELKTVNLGTISSIEQDAFYNCSGLQTITIPTTLTDFESGFRQCVNIIEYIVEPGHTLYQSHDGVVLNHAGTAIVAVPPAKKSYTLAPTITSIGEFAFRNSTLEEITVPSTVLSIGRYAFCEAKELKKMTFLSSASFGDHKPAAETHGEYNPNGTDPNPEEGRYGSYETNTVIPRGCFYECEKLTTVEGLPSTITTIGAYAFHRTGLENLDFLNSDKMPGLKIIGQLAFDHCPNLVKADLAQTTVEEIVQNAFADDVNLATLTFPETLTTIGDSPFARCNSLKDLVFPASLVTIGQWAFINCKGLETITIPANSMLKEINNDDFSGCSALTTVTINEPNSLTKIGHRAFQNCTSLESFTSPAGITTIHSKAFENCTSMTSLTLNENLTLIDNAAFKNCTGIEEVVLPSTVEEIRMEAFTATKIKEITLPAATTTVDPRAFTKCNDFTKFIVDEGNRTYCASDGILLTYDKRKLHIYPQGQATDHFQLLPPSITEIGDYALYECENLKVVVIPKKVTKLGVRTFGKCTGLTDVYFLGERFFDPEGIKQEVESSENGSSFDDQYIPNFDNTTKTNLHVRKKLLNKYQANINRGGFYSQFKGLEPSEEIANERNEYEDYFTFIDGDKTNQAILLETTNSNHTFCVPKTIEVDNTTYTVGYIGDYAFEKAPSDIREVIVFHTPKYIGANAFVTSPTDANTESPRFFPLFDGDVYKELNYETSANKSTIKRVFFISSKPEDMTLGSVRFNLKESDWCRNYNEFFKSQKAYVKKTARASYRLEWAKYDGEKDGHTILDYKIKPRADDTTTSDSYDFVKVSSGKKYSTFSREFDVDLGEYAAEKGEDAGRFDIKAFTMGVLRGGAGREQDYPEGNGETPSSTYIADYHLKMYHIGYEDDLGSDKPEYRKGTYIPNSTGVLLAVMNDWNGTPDDYFYCIGEDDLGNARNADAYINEDGYVNGTLHRAVETTTVLPAIEPDADGVYHPTQWVLQQGVFKPVKSKTVNLPPHKSWLYLDMNPVESQQGAVSAPMMAFGFSLDDNSMVTDIEAAAEEGRRTDSDGIYTITGVKVLRPETKGIYIINGKKHVIK